MSNEWLWEDLTEVHYLKLNRGLFYPNEQDPLKYDTYDVLHSTYGFLPFTKRNAVKSIEEDLGISRAEANRTLSELQGEGSIVKA